MPPPSRSPRSAGRKGTRTENDVVSISEFEEEIRDLDGNTESSNLLFYGDSGAGKTSLIGGLPRTLILACEPGYISAARVNPSVPGRKIREVRDAPTMLAALEYLEAGGWKKYRWIILEGSTTLETKVRLGYAAEAFDQNPAKRVHRNLPMQADYFNTQNFMRGIIPRLIDLPCHTIVTAHAMRMDDDEGDRVVLPAFQKKEGELSNYICGLFHVVGFLRKVRVDKGKREVRRVLFHERVDPKSGTRYFAKDQYNVLPKWMDDPSMTDIVRPIGIEEVPPRRRVRREG